MKQMEKVEGWICPRCGKEVHDYPALSRVDNKTEICSACGTKEAMLDFWKHQHELLEEKDKFVRLEDM